MSVRVKTILAILAAITLAGVGYFFIKPKSKVLPPINTVPQLEEIDTSDWQTYKNEKLGFEIKMPKEWVKSGEDIGNQPFLEDEFWQEQVGGATFIHSYEKGFPQFNVRVKDSDLSLKDFLGDSWEQYIFINDLPSKKSVHDARPRGSQDYQERIVIKSGRRYYFFEYFAGITDIPTDIKVWNAIISTFKSTP